MILHQPKRKMNCSYTKILIQQPECYMGGCYQQKIAEDEDIPLKLIDYNAIEYKCSEYFCIVYNIEEEEDPDDYVKLISVFKTNKSGGCGDNYNSPFLLFLLEIRKNIPMMTSNNYKEVCFSIQD